MSRGRLYRALTVLSMAVGRGPAARAVAASAKLSSDDRVVDIGCGPVLLSAKPPATAALPLVSTRTSPCCA